jgi:outer membrane lipoprotein SlyB
MIESTQTIRYTTAVGENVIVGESVVGFIEGSALGALEGRDVGLGEG